MSQPRREWWEQRRYYAEPPDIGTITTGSPVTHHSFASGGGCDIAADDGPVNAEIVEVGAHWSSQPEGRAGWWVRLRELPERS